MLPYTKVKKKKQQTLTYNMSIKIILKKILDYREKDQVSVLNVTR